MALAGTLTVPPASPLSEPEGSVTAGWEHFSDWKRINSEGEKGVISLETLIRGTCDKARFLDLVENFTAFDDSKGGLVISNKEPPPGSTIIKKQTLPDLPGDEKPQVQEGNATPPNGSATPSKPLNRE